MKKILIPVDDFDLSLSAIEYAGIMSLGVDSEIIVLHLADPKDYDTKEQFKLELDKLVELDIRPKLNKAAAKNPALNKIKLEVKGLESEISDHIIEFSNEQKTDLIIMATRGLPSSERNEKHLDDTTSYKVVLEAKCPVLTFSSLAHKKNFEKILLPLDLSDGSKFKVPLAIELAKQFGSEIQLLSAYESLTGKEVDELESLHGEIEELLTKEGIEVTCEIRTGERLDKAVLSYAEKGEADLVIVMSRPSTRWSELFVTPGAKRIISFSKIPVLSMRLKNWGSGL